MLVHPQFDPVAVALGPLSVRWYGLTYLAAFVLFLVLGRVRARRLPGVGFTVGDLDDLLFYGVVGVIVGGRLGKIRQTLRAFLCFYRLCMQFRDVRKNQKPVASGHGLHCQLEHMIVTGLECKIPFGFTIPVEKLLNPGLFTVQRAFNRAALRTGLQHFLER